MTAFQGLPDDIFSIYVPEKWSSNVYNLPRIRNKDLLLGLCDVVQQGLDKDLANLSRAASDEFPNIFNQKKVDAQV